MLYVTLVSGTFRFTNEKNHLQQCTTDYRGEHVCYLSVCNKEYLKLTEPGGFLTVPEHTGLILCSDGVQLFNSAKQSIWPILLSVTSLPPGVRMNAENIILAGIWQGPIKLPMNLIL